MKFGERKIWKDSFVLIHALFYTNKNIKTRYLANWFDSIYIGNEQCITAIQ